jgi:hypothetical protein
MRRNAPDAVASLLPRDPKLIEQAVTQFCGAMMHQAAKPK